MPCGIEAKKNLFEKSKFSTRWKKPQIWLGSQVLWKKFPGTLTRGIL